MFSPDLVLQGKAGLVPSESRVTLGRSSTFRMSRERVKFAARVRDFLLLSDPPDPGQSNGKHGAPAIFSPPGIPSSASTPTATASTTSSLDGASQSTIPSATNSLHRSAHHISHGAIVGIVLSSLFILSLIGFGIHLFCLRQALQKKRIMAVGKASRVDLADSHSEHMRQNFYNVQRPASPLPSIFLDIRGKPDSSNHASYMDSHPLPYDEALSRDRSFRRSIATFTSTSGSRSQGSMVIGSPAFWEAVRKGDVPKKLYIYAVQNPDVKGDEGT